MDVIHCEECLQVDAEVEVALQHLLELTAAQLDAFNERRHAAVWRINRELERAVGRKERALGAQRQHARQHGQIVFPEERLTA